MQPLIIMRILVLLTICTCPLFGAAGRTKITRFLPPQARAYFEKYYITPPAMAKKFGNVFASPDVQRKMGRVMVDYDSHGVPKLINDGFKFHKGLVENHHEYGRDFIFEHEQIPGWIFKLCGTGYVCDELRTLGRIWRTSQVGAAKPIIKQKFGKILTVPEKFAYPLPERVVDLPEMMVAAQALDLGQYTPFDFTDCQVIKFLTDNYRLVDVPHRFADRCQNAQARPAPHNDLAIWDFEPHYLDQPFKISKEELLANFRQLPNKHV